MNQPFIRAISRPLMRSIIRPIIATAATAAVWILAGGVWDDDAVWIDSETWKDAA